MNAALGSHVKDRIATGDNRPNALDLTICSDRELDGCRAPWLRVWLTDPDGPDPGLHKRQVPIKIGVRDDASTAFTSSIWSWRTAQR